MASSRESKNIEWIGAIVPMPTYVTGEGDAYRPAALLWMGEEGALLGHTVGKPEEVVGAASESFREAMTRPMWGRPHAPTRVRVSSPELASALRAGHPRLDVVCAPTPELDLVLDEILERMDEDTETEQSYLSPEISPDAVAALFRAAAALYRAEPWKIALDDENLISVTIEKLDVRAAVLLVIGEPGKSVGLSLFSEPEDCEAYLDAAEVIELGEEPSLPPHFALSFMREARLSSSLLNEISEHHWEVAADDAYPVLAVVDDDFVARPPTADEMTVAEAIALALPEMLKLEQELAAAWQGGEPLARTLSVRTHAGAIDVTLRAPYHDASPPRPARDVLADLQQLPELDDEMDPYARAELEDQLLQQFAASPEAELLTGIHTCHFIMNLAADFFGATIANLTPHELDELVFELIPRKLSIEASAARSIIEELRALYAFLKRECALDQAEACLQLLGADAVKQLEAALSDSSNFGLAKSLFMAGRAAGFDSPSQAAARGKTKAQAKVKKQKRKAERKARKKNR